jgi:hypothetical protein
MAKPTRPFHEMIENTSGLSQGVLLHDELLASIAISLKRIADSMEQPQQSIFEHVFGKR